MRTPSFVALAVLVAVGAARAQSGTWSTTRAAVPLVTAPGTVTLQQGSDLSRLLAGRSYIPHGSVATNGTTLLRDLLEAPPGPRGPIPGTYVQRNITWAATGKAIARGLPVVGTALAIAEVLDAVRCKTDANRTAWECDGGQPEQEYTEYPWTGSRNFSPGGVCGTVYSADAAGACQLANGNTYAPANISYTLGAVIVNTATQKSWNVVQTTCTTYTNPPQTLCTDQTLTNAITVLRGSPVVTERCPALPNGTIPTPGPDGQCPTGNYTPEDWTEVDARIAAYAPRAAAPQVVRELDLQGIPIEHDFPSVQDLPASIPGDRSITTRPDGDREVVDSRFDVEPTAEGYRWREVIETRVYPPNVDIPPPWTDTNPPDSSSQAPPEFKGCGLPDTPPCKIDETGTPSAQQGDDLSTAPRAAVDALRQQQVDLIETERQSDLPWLFDLGLPTGACTPIVLNLNGRTVEVDLCSNWLVLFLRELLAWALVVVTGIYCWRSVTLTTGAR